MILNRIVSLIQQKRNPAIDGYITIVYGEDRQPHIVHDSLSSLGSQFVPDLEPQKNHEVNQSIQKSAKENYLALSSDSEVGQWDVSGIYLNPATGLAIINGANIDADGNLIGHGCWESANDQEFESLNNLFE